MKGSHRFTGFGSLAIHTGHQEDNHGAHLTPVYATSAYVFGSAEEGIKRFKGEDNGYIYGRYGSPGIREAEEKLAAMEGFGIGPDNTILPLKAILHASGMAAISTLMFMTLQKGDKVLTHYSLYGGTEEMLQKILPSFGVTAVIADLRDLQRTADIVQSDPAIRMLYLETPANPTIRCVDIAALASLAKEKNIIVACDNTVATPYLQQPFRYGADFVIHSTTKFLNGHGTAIGGVLIGKDLSYMETRATKIHRLLGGNSNPFDTFLLLNGLRTLELRMKQHCANAEAVATWLNKHSAVSAVHYSGLPGHSDYEISQRQMRHAGALMSFELKGGFDAAIRFMNRLNMCTRAVSLGTCDTLISHPASMSHAGIGSEQRLKYGISDGLMRTSIGIENIEDILADLEQALA